MKLRQILTEFYWGGGSGHEQPYAPSQQFTGMSTPLSADWMQAYFANPNSRDSFEFQLLYELLGKKEGKEVPKGLTYEEQNRLDTMIQAGLVTKKDNIIKITKAGKTWVNEFSRNTLTDFYKNYSQPDFSGVVAGRR